MLYPLKFQPIFKHRIWGGNRLLKYKSIDEKSVKNVQFPIGESWDLSVVEGNESEVRNGDFTGDTLVDLMESFCEELVGESVFSKYGLNFPLLFKFIDAAENLSIQVHPNDDIAGEKHDSFGKTEMWYVIDAEPDSVIYAGLKEGVSIADCKYLAENGGLENYLNAYPVQRGDAILIPAGMVHALGKGVFVAEVQQSSDVTYRLYDYNRTDKEGNKRELHLYDALEVVDLEASPELIRVQTKENDRVPVVSCDKFEVNLMSLTKPMKAEFPNNDTFTVYMCVKGSAIIVYNGGLVDLKKGEIILIPAVIESVILEPQGECELLEIVPR